jgi:hypothetical protein
MAIEGIEPKHGRGFKVLVAVEAPSTGPFGCGDVTIRLFVEASRGLLRDHHRELVRPVRAAIVVGDEDAQAFETNSNQVKPTHADYTAEFPVFVVRDAWEFGETYTFRGPWASRRGFGSCWVTLPILNDRLIEPAAEEVVNGEARLSGPTTISSGLTTVNGNVNSAASIPPPTGPGPDVWRCRNWRAGDYGCSAHVAIDATWRSWFRDASLLICGVLLSLGVELLIRPPERAHGPAGG